MNVHNTPFKSAKEFSLEHSHKTGQRDQIHPGLLQLLDEGMLRFVIQLRPKLSWCDEACFDASLTRPRQDSRFIHVAYDERNLRGYFPRSARIRNGDKIRTLARTEHSDAK